MKNGFGKRLLAGILAAAVCTMLFCCVMSGNGTMAAAETVSAQAVAEQETAAYDYMVLVNKAHRLPDNWESSEGSRQQVGRNISGRREGAGTVPEASKGMCG